MRTHVEALLTEVGAAGLPELLPLRNFVRRWAERTASAVQAGLRVCG